MRSKLVLALSVALGVATVTPARARGGTSFFDRYHGGYVQSEDKAGWFYDYYTVEGGEHKRHVEGQYQHETYYPGYNWNSDTFDWEEGGVFSSAPS